MALKRFIKNIKNKKTLPKPKSNTIKGFAKKTNKQRNKEITATYGK